LEDFRNEAIVSPPEQAPHQQARLSCPHGHAVGAGRAFAPAEEGTQAADRVAPLEARRLLTPPARLPRDRRLAYASDIRHCLTHGRRRRLEHLDMIWMDNRLGQPRMGLIVPKFQSSAVARNRLRRRLKEIWRRDIQQQQLDGDLIIRARREAYKASFETLRSQLLAWRDAVLIGR
jgi:ribonuclease P protein component